MNPDPITLWYLDGKAAGEAGKKLADCPFGQKDWRRGEWIEGFWAGADQRKVSVPEGHQE